MPPACKQKQGINSAVSAGEAFAVYSLENARMDYVDWGAAVQV